VLGNRWKKEEKTSGTPTYVSVLAGLRQYRGMVEQCIVFAKTPAYTVVDGLMDDS
jgi:hypothetical protein